MTKKMLLLVTVALVALGALLVLAACQPVTPVPLVTPAASTLAEEQVMEYVQIGAVGRTGIYRFVDYDMRVVCWMAVRYDVGIGLSCLPISEVHGE